MFSMNLSRVPRLLLCFILAQHLASVAKSQCVSPPTIKGELQTRIKFETNTYQLECSADGIPPPRFTWKKKMSSETVALHSSSKHLTINRTDGEGTYTCLAANECGTALQEFDITIPRLGSFQARHVRVIEKDEGSWAILKCDPPEGSPSPEIHWTIDFRPVTLSDRVNVDNTTRDLIFANVLPSDQSYYYRCNARNSGRRATFSDPTELIVKRRDSSSIVNHGPTIIAHEDVEGFRGQQFRLECIATGRPTPSVTWSRLGEPIRSQVRQECFALLFDKLDISDAGIYRCQADTGGKSTFKNVTLTVKSAPYWTTKPYRHIMIGSGRSINIQCFAGGVPHASVKWLSNGEEVQDNEITPNVRVEEDEVVITNATVNDTTVLQCVADNTYGHIFTNVFLNIQPPPKPQWAAWSRWADCTLTCDNGVQHRTRNCTDFDPYDEIACVGKTMVNRTCNNFPCPECEQVCEYGVLNSDCDACVCDTSVLNGRVLDRNNRPLSGATIVYTDRPYATMATTNSTGMFSIDGICSSSQRMTVRKDMFSTVEVQTNFVNAVTSTLRAVLAKMELPFIAENPMDKMRTSGQSVAFCCRAESDPPPNKYEWFKDGDIIETPAAEKDMFILDNLSEIDSGSYRCRVHNDAGCVYSDEANLTVTASAIGCNPQPLSMLMKLPTDCVQPDTSKAEFDVGTCKKSMCAGPLSSQTSCADPDRESYCCQPVTKKLINLQCEDYTLPVQKVISCGCSECAQLPGKVFGTIVSSDTNKVLQYVSVYYKNKNVALSNKKGTFTLELPSHLRKASLTCKDDIFLRVVDSVKVVQLISGFTTYVIIKMKPRPVPVVVDSTAESYIPVASDSDDTAFAEMIIEPDTMYDMNGELLTGEVEISVNNIDMRNASNAEIAPGDFSFVDENGDLQPLQTFNLWSIDAKDKSGNPVSIGGSSTIMIDQETLPPCNFDENGACDIKLWVLNPVTGSWEVASELKSMTAEQANERRRRKRQSQGTVLVGNIDVANGEKYNIDIVNTNSRCFAKFLAYDSEELNTPINGGYEVQEIVSDSSNSWLGRDSKVATGTDGVCIPMPCADSGRHMAWMTATYENRLLVPVDNSISLPDKFCLTTTDIENLEYAIEEGPGNTALRIKPRRMYTNDGAGPLHPTRSCQTSEKNGNKHFQFFLPKSSSTKEVRCITVESAAEAIRQRTYITFYNNLPEFNSMQNYCFVGIRVSTSNTNVRIVVTSKIHDASRLKDLPDKDSDKFKDYTFGSREVRANPDKNTGNIDVCMEFKCGDNLYTGLDNDHGQEKTRVEVGVKGVSRECQVTPSGAFNGYLTDPESPTCHDRSLTTPFCFIDPLTYGEQIGIFKRSVDIAPGTNANDPNSPQNDNTDNCVATNGQFTPGLVITC